MGLSWKITVWAHEYLSEITKPEKKERERRWVGRKEGRNRNVQELWDNYKRHNIHMMEIAEREGRGRKEWKYLKQ
jgi:hypothetical protein